MVGLPGDLCTGEESIITYRMELFLPTEFLAQLVQGGLIIPATVTKPEAMLTPTPEVAPQSPIAGDRFISSSSVFF